MKKITLILVITLFSSIANAQILQWDWVRTNENNNATSSYSETSAVDSQGNVYVTGGFGGDNINFGNYVLEKVTEFSTQVYVAKYNSNGVILWAKALEHVDACSIECITIDNNDNLLISGRFNYSITLGNTTLSNTNDSNTSMFLSKIAPDGTIVWATEAGAAATSFGYAFVFDIVSDADSNIYVTGRHKFSNFIINENITLSGSGPSNYFIIKYNNSGIAQWAKKGNSITTAEMTSKSVLALDSNQNIFMAGPFSSSISFNGLSLSTSSSALNTFLVKFNPDGESQSIKKIGASGFVNPADLKIDSNNDIYMLGNYSSTSLTLGNETFPYDAYEHVFTTKLTSSGDVIWAKNVGGIYNDLAESLVVKSDAVYISGYFNSPLLTAGSYNLVNTIGNSPIDNENSFIVKYDQDGNIVTAYAPQNTGRNNITSLSAKEDYIYVTGRYVNELNIGSTVLSSNLGQFFVAKLNPETLFNAEFKSAYYMLYPNPAQNILNIQLKENVNANYNITDAMGRLVTSGTVNNQMINVSSLPSGMYLLSINNTTTKFIKE